MDSEAKWLLSFVVIVAILAASLVTSFYIETKHSEHMASQGYIQNTLPGKTGVYWVKPDEVKDER